MLILSRKVGEQIKINDDITIVLCRVDNDEYGNQKASIGIEAPQDVQVHRKEVYNKIKKEDRQ